MNSTTRTMSWLGNVSRGLRPNRGLLGLGAALALLATPLAAATTGEAAGRSEIQEISFAHHGDSVTVSIETTGRPNHSHYRRSNPLEVVVDLADMEPGEIAAVIPVHDGVVHEIQSTRLEKDGLVSTRLVIALDDARGYRTAVDGNTLLLEIERGDRAGEDAIADALDAIEDDDEDEPRETRRTKNPRRSEREEREHDRRTREVIEGDLSSVAGDHVYRSGGTRILGVDFQNFHDVSTLLITADGPIDYSARWATNSQYVLEIPSSSLGSGLERSLDTSKFPSAIDMVHCYQSRSQPGTTKVVIRMREHVEPTPLQEGNLLKLEFEIPPSVASARTEQFGVFGSYEAKDEEDGLAAGATTVQGAFTREQVITTGGESLDPSKKYGDPVSSGLMMTGMDWDLRSVTGGKAPRLINLDLVRADLHNVFRLISSVSGLNIVASEDVGGQVTVKMDRVPWDRALAAVLQSRGLGGVLYGNILRVAPLRTLQAEREAALQAKDAELELQDLNVLALPINYADAQEIASLVGGVLSERGSVAVDTRTNSLVIRDIEEGLRQGRLLAIALDTQTPQVLIEARIVEVNTNFSRGVGIQWGGDLNFSPATGMPTGLFFPNTIGLSGGKSAPIIQSGGAQGIEGITAFTTDPNWVVDLPGNSDRGSIGLALGSLTGVAGLDMRLTALESTGQGRVVSSPRIQVLTNESAYIKQGARVPYETASLRGTQVQFIEATLELNVTPSITSDGSIFLEVSVTKNQPDFGNTVGTYPTIEIKEAETVVMVPNGDTTVIGGVYSLEESEDQEYIPGIGKVPVLGALFKNKIKRKDRKEMLVFITPTILTRSTATVVSPSAARGD